MREPFIGQQPLTDGDRKRWPLGVQPIPMGIQVGNVSPAPTVNAVMVQLVDDRPIVTVLVNDETKRDELEALARRIIHSGAL